MPEKVLYPCKVEGRGMLHLGEVTKTVPSFAAAGIGTPVEVLRVVCEHVADDKLAVRALEGDRSAWCESCGAYMDHLIREETRTNN